MEWIRKVERDAYKTLKQKWLFKVGKEQLAKCMKNMNFPDIHGQISNLNVKAEE